MKTVIDRLKMLPRRYRTLALRSVQTSTALLESENLPHAIASAFVWHETPEGYDFWKALEQWAAMKKPNPPKIPK